MSLEKITNIEKLNDLAADGSVFIQYTNSGYTCAIFKQDGITLHELSTAVYAKLNKAAALYNPGIRQVDITKLKELCN